jgi:uncharacterized protein DUF4043
MAVTSVPTNTRVIKWQRDFYREYIRANRFAKYMGADESSPIQINEDLTKTIGEQVNFELVNRLVGNQNTSTGAVSGVTSGITGYNTLEGNEEALGIRNFRVRVDRTRWAVTHDGLDEQFSAIDLVEAKNATLKDHAKENIRDRIVLALGSISTDGSTHQAYESANSTDRNTWLSNNTDRVAFGVNLGTVPANHAAGITLCDTTADTLTKANLQILKDIAKTANPKIRPIKVNDEEEWFVVFTGTKNFRVLQNDLATLNQSALAATNSKDNPLYTSGDLMYDGMIIREVPEIVDLSGTPGAGGTTLVQPAYLLGTQAIAYAIAQRTKMITQERDYGAKKGAGYQFIDAVAKIYFGAGAADATTPKQNGVVTGYYAHA